MLRVARAGEGADEFVEFRAPGFGVFRVVDGAFDEDGAFFAEGLFERGKQLVGAVYFVAYGAVDF